MNLNYSFFPMTPSALDAQKKAERQEFWRKQSAKVPASHHLPCYVTARDKVVDSAVNTAKHLSATSQLNVEQAAQLQAMSDVQNVSPMAGVLALIHGLLARYSNETAQSVKLLDAANLDGDASVLVWDEAPLSSLSDAAALVEQQLQAISENLLPNQDYPAAFRDSVTGTKIAVISGSLASKDIAAAVQDSGVQGLGIEGSGIDLAAFVHTVSAESFAEVSNAASLAVTWVANAEVFNANALQLFATHFENLADAALAQPNLNLAQLSLVTNAEEKRWDALNTVTLAYPDNECLASLFESQADKTPNSTAVVTQHTQVNYAQLNGLGNQFARFLLTQIDTKTEAPLTIGVCLPRSAAMVAVILAIHKIGAAYVPLDPNYPAERLAYMAENAQISAVICTARNRDIFPQSNAIELALTSETLQQQDLACLTEKVKGFANDNVPRAGKLASTERLSHVIYTSGSTGKPKGVAVRHRNTVAMLFWAQSAFSEAELSKVLFSTSLNFDLSVFELFVPLCFGHQCYVVENILDLLHWSPEVTLINTVPSAAQSVLAQQAIPNTVVTVNLAGEPLSAVLVNDLLATTHCSAVCNLYGPSEDTTYSTYARFTSPLEGVPSIGQVLPNSQALILSPAGQQVPDGVEGELYLAGAGVAAGYLHNQALTAERFVANPFYRDDQPCSTAIMYKTGDKVRREADGTLSFLGRFDFQVKVRGFRIELGEIEHQLNQLNHVTDALVSVEGEGSQARLVAYLAIPEKALSDSVTNEAQWQAQAREQLSQKLPEYMLPDVMLLLAEFPRLPNGKVDRKKLPTADSQLSQATYRAPSTATEQALCDISQALLNIERIGVDDNFFHLGGNSLLAAQVSARFHREHGQYIPLPLLLASKTLGEVAQQLANTTELTIAAKNQQTYSLSAAQQGMWFIEQLNKDKSAQDWVNPYHEPYLFKLSEHVDRSALKAALINTVNRHSAIAGLYQSDDHGAVTQQYRSVDTVFANSTSLTSSDELNKACAEAIAQRFDLTKESSLRVHEFVMSDNAVYWLIVWHHISLDGWSLNVFLEDWARLYSGSDLPPLSINYGDYAHWEQQQLQGDKLQTLQQFWVGELEEYSTVNLPLDYERPAVFEHRGDQAPIRFDASMSAALRTLAKKEQTSVFTVLLAGFYVLLQEITGQDDLVVSIPSDNRNSGDLADVVGLFANTLPMRAKLQHIDGFSQLIKQVHGTVIRGKNHQMLPFERIVDALGVTRDVSRLPITPVFFAVQHFGETPERLPIQTETLNALTVAKADINITMDDSGDSIHGFFNYATALFSPATISRWAQRYTQILATVVKQDSLASLSALSADDIARLQQWNNTARDFANGDSVSKGSASEQCVAENLVSAFEQSVARHPQKTALISAESRLSFDELNQRANRLAHRLLATNKISSQSLVGVCLPRGAQLIEAILGILKAGAAYVPLDPSYPASRLEYMRDNAELACVVTAKDLPNTAIQFGERAVYLDETGTSGEHSLQNLNENPNTVISANDLAYVIYTSGSTGQPKGVMIEHASALNLGFAMQEKGFDDAAWGWMASAAFDASVQGVAQLMLGQTLSVFTEADKKDVQRLAPRLNELSVLDATPTLVEIWLDSSIRTHLPHMFIGGEAISESLWQRLIAWQQETGKQVYNVYGPTESTVNATWSKVTGEKPNIGSCLPNITGYVVNSRNQLVADGVVGELLLGGTGLARGYLNLPEMTAERFALTSFAELGEAGRDLRLYRTGDLVKRLDDGQLFYVGRSDEQVKVSGYRIELDEVIAALHQCEGVQQATVIADKKVERLLGYVVSEDAAVLNNDEKQTAFTDAIRQTLHTKLPEYMVPALIIPMLHMPLTVNGKIDKAALPAPDAGLNGTAYRAPRNDVEKQLCEIWQTVLQLPQVGIDDNFFQLGGTSLAAVRVGNLCRTKVGSELPLPLLFEHKTIARLQEHLVEDQQQITARNLNEYPMSFAQERMWFIKQFDTQTSAYHIPYLMKLNDDADLDRLLAAIASVLQRHVVTTGRFNIDQQGQVFQSAVEHYHANPQVLDVTINNVFSPVLDVTNAEEKALELASEQFDFAEQAGVKVYPMRDNQNQRFVYVLWHHLLFDGWSQGVFFSDVAALYANQPLPALPLQYGDYALWQREKLQGEHAEQQKAYWLENLSDFVLLDLPADHKRPSDFDFKGDIVDMSIDAELIASLSEFAKQEETTLYTVMLSGFFLLLQGLSGQNDIVVGTASDNRDEGGVADLVGLFVNSLAIRQNLTTATSVSDVVQQVHQTILAAKRHQQLPFEQVLDALDVDRDLSRTPLFQVMFTMQDALEMPKQVPAQLVNFVQDNVAKFDLSLLITQSADGAVASFNYARSIYDKTRVTQWAHAYTYVLQQMLSAKQLSDVSILTDQDREQLLHKWHRNVDFGDVQHLIKRFSLTVAENAQKTALITANETLSFADLNARANQVAHYLLEKGATQNNSYVGVCLSRSIDFIIAIVGIWKAGGAYVPLDPQSPITRLKHIASNAQLTCVISNDEQIALAQQLTDKTMLLQAMDQHPTTDVVVSTDSNDTAYIIYTSGSTGKPKGVIIPHKAIANLMYSLHEMGFDDGEKSWGWLANVAFDGSLQGISQLMLGQSLSIISDSEKEDIDALAPRFAEMSMMDTTPALVEVWLDTPLFDHLPSIVIGGEAISEQLWKRLIAWQQQTGRSAYNEYGPTETTVICTYHLITEGPISIGLSLPNTCAYVMNDQQQLLPFDSVGELVIGGLGVANGYVDLPEMTAERFIDNPFYDESDPASSPRLYRSGDRVKRLSTGELVFCGRNDDQVKVRGYRIELDEVTAGLNASELAQQQVRDLLTILVKHGATGDATLVSFYIPKDEAIAQDETAAVEQAEQLIEAAKDFIPEFMLPKRLVALAEFPITPNGKVDKANLPIPNFSARQSEYVAPETELQHQVSALFTQLLGVDKPSIHDDFFALGGHSLIATRLSNLVTVQFSVPLRVKDIFLSPTVATIADRIETLQNDAAEPQIEQRVTKFHEDDAFDMDTFEL